MTLTKCKIFSLILYEQNKLFDYLLMLKLFIALTVTMEETSKKK